MYRLAIQGMLNSLQGVCSSTMWKVFRSRFKSLFTKKNKTSGAVAELQKEVAHQPLSIEGIFPEWLSGTLVRNGPVNVKVGSRTNEHWFDGPALLHAFTLYRNEFKNWEFGKKVP